MDNYTIYLKRFRRRRYFQLISPYLPLILFAATVFTTLFAGALMQFERPLGIIRDPSLLLKGVPFAIPLMLILLTHEMGHYITSRIHRVKATLPYFIPFPNYIGTFGAVIKMKSPMRDRRSLLDIGAAGPLAGFVISIIAVAWGLAHADIISIDQLPEESYWNPRIAFGPNLAFLALLKWFGPFSLQPDSLIVNPIMDAGWLGLFVTNLNLMPASQLDGGHIAYALLGRKRAHKLARIMVFALISLGIYGFATTFFPGLGLPIPIWPGYAIWALLILVIGLKHPPPSNTDIPVGKYRKAIGIICLAVWVLTFSPVPFMPL